MGVFVLFLIASLIHFILGGFFLYENEGGVTLFFLVGVVFFTLACYEKIKYNNTPNCTHEQVKMVYTDSQNETVQITFIYCDVDNKLGNDITVTLPIKEYQKLLLD